MNNKFLENENIIAILGIQNLPDEQKLKIVDSISELVQKRLMARILESLDEEDKEEFIKLLQSNDQQALNKFLDSKIPNFLDWIEQETAQIKIEFKDWSNKLEL